MQPLHRPRATPLLRVCKHNLQHRPNRMPKMKYTRLRRPAPTQQSYIPLIQRPTRFPIFHLTLTQSIPTLPHVRQSQLTPRIQVFKLTPHACRRPHIIPPMRHHNAYFRKRRCCSAESMWFIERSEEARPIQGPDAAAEDVEFPGMT